MSNWTIVIEFGEDAKKQLRDLKLTMNELAHAMGDKETVPARANGKATAEEAEEFTKKKGDKGKGKKINTIEDDFLDDEETLDSASDDVTDDLGDEEEETDEIETSQLGKKGKAPSIEDVQKALQTYSKKTSREKAVKVLRKYGVKSVHDLDKKQYAQVIAATQ